MAALQQLERENMSMRIYRQIRDALMDGQYVPKERLVINKIAAELGVSNTPVREAIFRLVSEQALDFKTATGIYVPVLTADRLREIQLIRSHLEGEAAFRAAKIISPTDLDRLRRIQDEFVNAAASDPKLASLKNRHFHFTVMEIAGMPTLYSVVENMWVMMGPLLTVFHQTVPVRQLADRSHRHFEVLAALETGDGPAARSAIQSDIAWGKVMIDWVEENFDSSIDEQEARKAGGKAFAR